MSLIPSGQNASLEAVADALWDTFQKSLTIVKKALISATNESGGFIPGFGSEVNRGNFTYTPESGTFMALRVLPKPDGTTDFVTTKSLSQEEVLIKVQQEARDYIMDGREIEHAIFAGKTYNFLSQETTAHFLGKTYFYFRLSLTT
jgi:hypothetical protein